MRIYRVKLVAALATTVLVSAACGSAGTSPPQASTPARVDVTISPSAIIAVASAAGLFTVKVVDAKGLAVPGVAVSFIATGSAIVSPASATTDASGVASTQVSTSTIAGQGAVQATVSGVATAASAAMTVIAGPATKIAVAPKALRFLAVGDTARIAASAQDQYGNSSPSSAIMYSVVDGSLLSVDQTGLVRVLRLNGTTLVISASNSRADTTTVTVLGAGASNCTGLAASVPMAVGAVQTFQGVQYGCLPGSATGAEYVMVAFNSSTDQVNSLTASVKGNGLGVPPTNFMAPLGGGAVALRAASGFGDAPIPQLDERFHTRLLAQANAEFRGSLARARAVRRLAPSRSITPSSLGQSAASYATIPATAKVGDVITLNVSGSICTGAVNHALRVAAVGTKSIVLADTLNPAGGFVDADYQKFATNFDTLVYPLDVGAFGEPSDIDNNGRVAIIFTLTVNELTPAKSNFYVGGFFNPRDLFPKVGAIAADNCPGSNEGEMFYLLAPDPTGKINGNARSTDFVDSLTTGVLAHEFQHLINGSRRMSVNKATDFEEVWLNEGLSHIAEELLYYRQSGLGPRQNLNDSTIRIINRPTYRFWKSDAAANFSRFLDYLRSPGLNSPYANDDALATRGATWSFLRYAADRLATTDGTIWQRFDNATVTGQATLLSVFGTDPSPLFRDWAVANYLDDFGTNTDPRFSHKSWNFRDIYTMTFTNILTYPLLVNRLPDNSPVNLSIRGGSANYLRIAVPLGTEALLTLTSGGGTPSAPLQFVVVRTK